MALTAAGQDVAVMSLRSSVSELSAKIRNNVTQPVAGSQPGTQPPRPQFVASPFRAKTATGATGPMNDPKAEVSPWDWSSPSTCYGLKKGMVLVARVTCEPCGKGFGQIRKGARIVIEKVTPPIRKNTRNGVLLKFSEIDTPCNLGLPTEHWFQAAKAEFERSLKLL